MAGKKKSKKKGDIFARMSVDQRRQYLEKKAAQEQERTRRREELLAGFMKLKLEDERDKSSINEAKLNVRWREILRQVKSDSLVTQLKDLNQWIADVAEAQTKVIELLMKTLKEASQQRMMASQKHLSFVQSLAGFHEEHISLMTFNFRKHQTGLIIKTSQEIQKSSAIHIHHIKNFQLTEDAAKESTNQKEQQEYSTFIDAIADVKTKLQEEATHAVEVQEAQLEEAWWQLASVAKESEQQTKGLSAECKSIQEKVDRNLRIGEKVDQEIREMQSEISAWKSKFSKKEEFTAEETSLNALEMSLQVIRNSLNSQQCRMRSSIRSANRIVQDAFEKLQSTGDLGEEILYLANFCRRQETTEDKNLPFLPTLPPSMHVRSMTEEVFEEPRTGSQIPSIRRTSVQQQLAPQELESIPKVSKPTLSDSGVGTSIVSERQQQYKDSNIGKDNSILEKTLPQSIGSSRETNTQLIDSDKKISTRVSSSAIPPVTLQRINHLIQDENALKEITELYGHSPQLQSEFVTKETEIHLQTHENLSHFWCKLNNVEVQRLSLMKEAQDLKKENKILKEALENFFYSQGITSKSFTTSRPPLEVSSAPMIIQSIK